MSKYTANNKYDIIGLVGGSLQRNPSVVGLVLVLPNSVSLALFPLASPSVPSHRVLTTRDPVFQKHSTESPAGRASRVLVLWGERESKSECEEDVLGGEREPQPGRWGK